MKPYSFLNAHLSEIDKDTARIIEFEKRRQERKIILIASESICPAPVLEAQASVFSNLYAEGYPSLRMIEGLRENGLDFERFLALHRRLGDRRHYQGCDYVNFIEALAQWRAAQLFAHEEIGIRPEDIFVNVQPLSGAAANNAVYFALATPGDTVLGMALAHGGHLTHGSPFNRSGKIHRGIFYEIDPSTGRIAYDQVRKLALEHRPKMIIAGASAYPWDIDWKRLREIADEAGAMLMSDIAHPSGLVAARLFPNPVGYAHVTTLTTHKTLCGPRAAIILTTDAQLARRIENAVFPGEQGGPHINTIAALAVTFQLAATSEFRDLMKRVVENARCLAQGLASQGLKLAYGGTNTHLCLVDLKDMMPQSGFPLKGDIAALILDLCGITCNKNTIAGDTTASDSSAIRLGTTWVTQLGMGPVEMDRLAELIHLVLTSIRTYPFHTPLGLRYRGKIPEEIMLKVRQEVARLVHRDEHPDYPQFPHYHAPFTAAPRESLAFDGFLLQDIKSDAEEHAVLVHCPEMGLLEIVGEKAEMFLADLVPINVYEVEEGKGVRTFLFDRHGHTIADIHLFRMPERGEPRFLILANPQSREYVKEWLSDLSDGYALADEECACNRLTGPVIVRDLYDSVPAMTVLALTGRWALEIISLLDASLTALGRFSARELVYNGSHLTVARTGYREGQELWEIYLPLEDMPKFTKRLQELSQGKLRQGTEAIVHELRAEAGLPASAGDVISLYQKFPHYFSPGKPYFVGKAALGEIPGKRKEAYLPKTYQGPVRNTPLALEHEKRTSQPLVPVAGWLMPSSYTSVLEEHDAVRNTAAIFDLTFMGTMEIRGKGAERYLDLVTTNEVSKLEIGEFQYSFILSAEGAVIADVLIYKREKDRFMLAVNAESTENILGWLKAIACREILIDPESPSREVDVSPEIYNLQDVEAGEDRKVDIALQGPRSRDILLELTEEKIVALPRSRFAETTLKGTNVIVSRSGYTGEEWGYEFYVHPKEAPLLWNLLLEKGNSLGLKPAGIGASESARIEAGLPVHGRELEGPYKVTPAEAGYGSFVKYYKPFFVGKKGLLIRDDRSSNRIVRFETPDGPSVHPDTRLSDEDGNIVGRVTSCTSSGGRQIGLAYVRTSHAAEGRYLFYKPCETMQEVRVSVRIISRFLRKESSGS